MRNPPPLMLVDSWVTDQLIHWFAGQNPDVKMKKALRNDLDHYALELAGPNPSPAEALLAQTVSINWFALRVAEANFLADESSPDGTTFQQSEHAQKRLDRAHRRLLASLKTLATIRRLGVPTIQVNLAHQQVNVANSSL